MVDFDFGPGDDAVALAIADARTDYGGVWVELTQNAAKAFGVFTQKHVGEVMNIVVDGQVLASPMIMSPILGGRMQLVGEGRMEFERAWTMALRLKTGDAKLVMRVNRLAPR
jgi:preprotein translocase subunit SecD